MIKVPGDVSAKHLKFEHDDVAGYKPKMIVDDGGGHKGYETNFPHTAFHLNNTEDEWLCRYKTGIYMEITSKDTSGCDAGIIIVHNAREFTKAAASQGMVVKELGMGTVAYFGNFSDKGGRGGPLGVEFDCGPGLIGSVHHVGSGGMGIGVGVDPSPEGDAIGIWPTREADGTALWISDQPNDLSGKYRHTEIKMNGDILVRGVNLMERIEQLEQRIRVLEEKK